MGQELFDVQSNYSTAPRVFYLAVSSNGTKSIRGSAYARYSHAVLEVSDKDYSKDVLTWGWYCSRLDLAEGIARRENKSAKQNDTGRVFEVIELKTITAKEVRQLKKVSKKLLQEYYNKIRNEKIGEQDENNA